MPQKSRGDRSLRADQTRKKKNVGKRSKKKSLTPRQAKLLKGIVIEQKTPRQAAFAAGYSERMANNTGALLDTIAMREAMQRFLASPEHIAQRINEGLDAIETKFFQFEGVVTDRRDVIAWGERRMYADLAAELKGLKPSQKVEHGGQVAHEMKVTWVNVDALDAP